MLDLTGRMSDVGLLQVGCRIFTSRMSDFNKWDVGFLQVGCRIFTSRKSDFHNSDVECRIFKVGCRMAPISFRTIACAYPWCAQNSCYNINPYHT